MIRLVGLSFYMLLWLESSAQQSDSIRTAYYYDKAYRFGIYHLNYQTCFDSLIANHPQDAYYWQQKGMPLLKSGKNELGMSCLDSAVKYKPGYIDYRAFMKCIFQRDYSGAYKDFQQAIREKGESFIMDHSYTFYMSLCMLQMNRLREADSLLDRSFQFFVSRKSEPHYLELFYKGIIRMEQEKFNDAIDIFDKVLIQYSQFPDAMYYKAYCLEITDMVKGDSTHNDEIIKLYNSGLAAINKGYALNEDNAIYRDYPYQVRKIRYEYAIKRLKNKE